LENLPNGFDSDNTSRKDSPDQWNQAILSLAEVKDRMQTDKPCSLLTLLWTFRDRLASDPRDKIYSLLGVHDQFKRVESPSTMAMSEATGEFDMIWRSSSLTMKQKSK